MECKKNIRQKFFGMLGNTYKYYFNYKYERIRKWNVWFRTVS